MKKGEIERMLTIIDKNDKGLSETAVIVGLASVLLVDREWKPALALGLLVGALDMFAPAQKNAEREF